MNLTLAMIVVAEVCLGICAWRSSECLRWLAAHLLTQADVIDLSKAETVRRLQFWSRELGVESHAASRGSRNGVALERGLARSGTAS